MTSIVWFLLFVLYLVGVFALAGRLVGWVIGANDKESRENFARAVRDWQQRYLQQKNDMSSDDGPDDDDDD